MGVMKLDAQRADRLREIAIKLKQNGLTVSGCAKGLRMLMMLKKYGLEDDEIEEKSNLFFKRNLYQMSRSRTPHLKKSLIISVIF